MTKHLTRFAALLWLACAPLLAQAQLHITTEGVGSKRIPIAIAEFADEGQSPEPISSIIKADLSRSGYFTIIDTPAPMSETAAVNYNDWKTRGAFALAAGSVQKLADGRFVIRYRLYDISKGAQLSGFAETVYTDRLRLAAHKISDDIYEKLTGVPGDFS
ncbi:MAG: Tol-Pal system protein TolB, partial [Burkholderiaceae bacterium]|nr:Tol-Pal system protein TolB [Burkholderiaceae bacterium]